MNIVFVGDNIKNQESLPLYGVGPYLIGSMLSISVLGIILSHYNLIPVFKYDSLNWLLIGLAIVLILDAAFLWLAAVRISNITKKLKMVNWLQMESMRWFAIRYIQHGCNYALP